MDPETVLALVAILVIVVIGFIIPYFISPRRDQWKEKRRETRIGFGLTIVGTALGVFLALLGESWLRERTERDELAYATVAAVNSVSYRLKDLEYLISKTEEVDSPRRILDANLIETPYAVEALASNPLLSRYAPRGAFEVEALTSWMKGTVLGATHPALSDSVRLQRLKDYGVALESTRDILTAIAVYVRKDVTRDAFYARVDTIRAQERRKLPKSYRPPITTPFAEFSE